MKIKNIIKYEKDEKNWKEKNFFKNSNNEKYFNWAKYNWLIDKKFAAKEHYDQIKKYANNKNMPTSPIMKVSLQLKFNSVVWV